MKKILITLFFLSLVSLGALALLPPQASFSENENRTLKTNSSVSADVISGKFMEDVESLLSDQFPFRGLAVRADSALKQASGRRDIDGAYIGRGRLFQKITDADIDFEKQAKTISKLQKLKNDFPDIPVHIMPVPSAGTELEELLPEHAAMYDINRIYDNFSGVDGFEVIDLRGKLRDESCYYRTDHHWTLDGAYEAYKQWQAAHGRGIIPLEGFEPETVSSDFYGTLYSKVIYTDVSPDRIEITAVPENVTVLCDGREGSVYDMSALGEKDKYRVFFGGNYGTVVIKNPDSASGEKLLVLKDSFANCFVPLIIGDYSEIVMIDERYAAVSLSEMIELNGITEIAVIKEASSTQ